MTTEARFLAPVTAIGAIAAPLAAAWATEAGFLEPVRERPSPSLPPVAAVAVVAARRDHHHCQEWPLTAEEISICIGSLGKDLLLLRAKAFWPSLLAFFARCCEALYLLRFFCLKRTKLSRAMSRYMPSWALHTKKDET